MPEQIIDLSMMHKCNSLPNLVDTIYPQLNVEQGSPTFLKERTILSARNEDVSAINSTCL